MSHLHVTQSDALLHIELNRPDKLNALNAALFEELADTLSQAQRNPAVRALVLSGRGKAFCAGADITEITEADAIEGLAFANRGQQVFRQLETLGKPSIAAIHGYALGGGCELAMAATLRIASVDAVFGQPEIKLGIMPGYGGTARLARLVGKGRALDLCLTGRNIDARQAEAWGLVTQLVDASDNVVDTALAQAHRLTQLAPIALDHIMQTIDQGFDLPLAQALALEANHFALLCATQDKQRGIEAFLQKRAATFSGE
jgi:enoyl-CoA hydratase